MIAIDALPETDAARTYGDELSCFVVYAGGAMFGLPVDAVHAIFRIQSITPVPLGPPVVLGLVNLRGKIVTAVSLARRLNMSEGEPAHVYGVAIDSGGESYALVVDAVGDAMTCRETDRAPTPTHVSEARANLTQAYYRIEAGLLPVLDIDALFELNPRRSRHENRAQHEATHGADT